MAKQPDGPTPQQIIEAFLRLPYPIKVALAVGAVIVACIALAVAFYLFTAANRPGPGPVAGEPGTYFFCSWNVENFFDDVDDPNNRDEDENFFAAHPELFKEKVSHLAQALLLMNDGRGPDVLALCEVENEHCLEALRDEANARLAEAGKGELRYANILFEPDRTGRRFAPGILTRLPVVRDRTRKLGAGGLKRILEGHIDVGGHGLVVIAAHWTSRVTDKDGHTRMRYAEQCYGRFRAILTEDPDADVVVCGDFNDEFRDPSVRNGLHASDNPEAVRAALPPDVMPLDLCARFGPGNDPPGTIYGRGKWSTFDHICLSRGLLDEKGWSYVPDSVRIFAPKELRTGRRDEPFAFGKPKHQGPRGFSDHFPVTALLRVGP